MRLNEIITSNVLIMFKRNYFNVFFYVTTIFFVLCKFLKISI